MEAEKVYIKLTTLTLKSASHHSRRRIQELSSGIVELRQLLSCAVCSQLLRDPFEPKERPCGHHVCRLCLRGRKRLFPSCVQCEDCCDYKTYVENKSMALLLVCYKTLCIHLHQSSLYSQLADMEPEAWHCAQLPRLKLPAMSTQWIIQEGMHYDDMCDTFFPQPVLPSLHNLPPSLPAETPPTTAATTPELPYEQHTPEQLSMSDIKMEESVATGDEAQFASPLHMFGNNNHISPQTQQQVMLPDGYTEPCWTDQVDLSAALSLPAGYTTYVMPSSDLHMPAIGQVIHVASVDPSGSSKHRHDEMILEEVELEELQQEQVAQHVEDVVQQMQNAAHCELEEVVQQQCESNSPLQMVVQQQLEMELHDPVNEHDENEDADNDDDGVTVVPTTMYKSTRMNLRNQKPATISSVHVKPATAAADPVAAAATAPSSEAATQPSGELPVAGHTVTCRSDAKRVTSSLASAPVTSTPIKNSAKDATQMTVNLRKLLSKDSISSHICRCGTTSAPGKMTCRNSRCACYLAGKSCVNCKCIGCKNPHQDASDSSDDDESKLVIAMDTDKEEQQPADKSEAASPPSSATASGAGGMQPGYTMVPLDNLQQTQHPLVLMQNENGQYQGFNIFNGNEPVDPAQLGFHRVPLRSNDGNTSIPEFAYVMPTPASGEPSKDPSPEQEPKPEGAALPEGSQSPKRAASPSETDIEQPAKKYKSGSFFGDIVKVMNADAEDSSDLVFEENMPENEEICPLYIHCTTFAFSVCVDEVIYAGSTSHPLLTPPSSKFMHLNPTYVTRKELSSL